MNYNGYLKQIIKKRENKTIKDKLSYFYYAIIRFFENLKIQSISKYQKLTRETGVSDYECWGLCHHLLEHNYPYIKQFTKMKKWAHPYDTKDENEWQKILEEILFAFEYAIAREYIYDKKYRDIVDKFFEKYGNEFFYDVDLYRRSERGFKLYGKYFMSLWD